VAQREELTESGGRLPQPTEEVHLPDPSYLPALVAFGITLLLVGIVSFWPVAIIGAIIAVWSIARWIRMVRVEMSELPLEH
jgi:hypothetical protein